MIIIIINCVYIMIINCNHLCDIAVANYTEVYSMIITHTISKYFLLYMLLEYIDLFSDF